MNRHVLRIGDTVRLEKANSSGRNSGPAVGAVGVVVHLRTWSESTGVHWDVPFDGGHNGNGHNFCTDHKGWYAPSSYLRYIGRHVNVAKREGVVPSARAITSFEW